MLTKTLSLVSKMASERLGVVGGGVFIDEVPISEA